MEGVLLSDVIYRHHLRLHPVMPLLNSEPNPYIFDFSKGNKELKGVDFNDEHAFTAYVFGKLKEHGKKIGMGGYAEDRAIYERSEVFGTARSIHLGIDFWAPEGSRVCAPLDGEIHSFANNHQHGDYGPTIILKHEIEGYIFHTLYGHLSKSSLEDCKVGDKISGGQQIATLGNYDENVHWPPHLHFQVIINMRGKTGDYQGVCAVSERTDALKNSPDPSVLLVSTYA